MIEFRQDAFRSVGFSPREKVIVVLAWAKAHATGGLARIVFSLALVVGATGCTGGSTEPASNVDEPPVPAVADTGPALSLSGRDDSSTSPAVSESTVTMKDHQEAREAFKVLISPGSDPTAWEAAQQQLVDLGAGATPVLLSGLASQNPIERETAATVCALTGAEDARIQAALLKCLADESSFVRANAAAALAQVPQHQPQVIATLTDLLSDSDPQLRRMAAANLGSFGAEASGELPKLTAVLADNDAEVVTPVIQLLGRMGPSAVEAIPQLQKIAFEQDGELKQAAEQALLLIQADGTDNSKPGE